MIQKNGCVNRKINLNGPNKTESWTNLVCTKENYNQAMTKVVSNGLR